MTILNYGSLNIDYVYRVPHLVAPGETLACTDYEIRAGGKGANQSAAAALAGRSVRHAGQVGKEGQFLIDDLAEKGVDVSSIRVGEVPTGHAIIQVDDNGENSIVIYGGGNRALDQAGVDALLDSAAPGDVVLLQNEVSHVDYAIEGAHRRGLAVCLNPAPLTPAVRNYQLAAVTTLIVNEGEGAALVGGSEADEVMAKLKSKYPDTTVILTLGGDGLVAREGDEEVVLAAESVPVVDTTAAGDTFIGYYLARREAGDDLRQALLLANRASGIAVSRDGAIRSIPRLQEVLRG